MKKRIMLLCLISMLCLLAACKKGAEEEQKIRIGMKDFTENLIIGEIYALALEDAGYTVERVPNIASSVIHTTIMNDEIDLYPEYTGTGLLSVLQLDMMTEPEEVYQTVKEEYESRFDLIWLSYAQANDGQGLVIRTEVAEELGIDTISDLQKQASEIRFASQGEFDEREDGMIGLEKIYGKFAWKSSKIYDNGLKYKVLSNSEADVSPAYTTEGQLVREEFTLLVDDKQVWPPYNLAPVVRKEVWEEHGEIETILNKISSVLTTETVTELNAAVDVEKQEYEEVAKEFYNSL